MVLGRISHFAFDAVLFSAFLAGVKRSTGLTIPGLRLFHSPRVHSESITDSKDIQRWIQNYLWVGEVVMDQGVAIMSSSSYFERKR